MPLNSIEELLQDIRQGRPVILMDDEDRENEGDLIIAAEKINAEMVNFMIREARGLLCLSLTGERCDFLGLSQMVDISANRSEYGTPFTVSIEAREGVTTGISAHDRARTILTAVDPLSLPQDIVQPGHIFPLRARQGGVLSRAGHTEAGCDLVRLAGLTPAAAMIEIMNEDGSMARRSDLEAFAVKHGLKIGTIAHLIQYRMLHEKMVQVVDKRVLNTDFGSFDLFVYQDSMSKCKHLALSKGRISRDHPTLVRVHSPDPLRDLLTARAEQGKLGWPIHKVLEKVAQEGVGVVVLVHSTDDQDFGMALERFVETSEPDFVGSPSKAYQVMATGWQILRDMGVEKVRLLSSPMRFLAPDCGLEIVEYLPFDQ